MNAFENSTKVRNFFMIYANYKVKKCNSLERYVRKFFWQSAFNSLNSGMIYYIKFVHGNIYIRVNFIYHILHLLFFKNHIFMNLDEKCFFSITYVRGKRELFTEQASKDCFHI